MSNDQAVRGFYPGYRARKIAKIGLVSSLIFLTVLASIGTWLPGLVSLFGSLLPPSTSQTMGACSSSSPNSTNNTITCIPPTGGPGSVAPNLVGADKVPSLFLPKTVLSSVDSLIGAGGVIQSSPQNLTIYNLDVSMRLLGGQIPHDELLGPGGRTLSSWSFWGMEANVSGLWT